MILPNMILPLPIFAALSVFISVHPWLKHSAIFLSFIFLS
jgi:hypothetical protein